MARKLRVQYPGAVYHVMSRGNRHERIFVDDQDQRKFLQTLGEACQKTGWQVHAYCLMNNHFHAVVETPEPNLVDGMKWLLGEPIPLEQLWGIFKGAAAATEVDPGRSAFGRDEDSLGQCRGTAGV